VQSKLLKHHWILMHTWTITLHFWKKILPTQYIIKLYCGSDCPWMVFNSVSITNTLNIKCTIFNVHKLTAEKTLNPKIIKTPKQYSIQHQYYHALNDPKPSNKFSALERKTFPDFLTDHRHKLLGLLIVYHWLNFFMYTQHTLTLTYPKPSSENHALHCNQTYWHPSN